MILNNLIWLILLAAIIIVSYRIYDRTKLNCYLAFFIGAFAEIISLLINQKTISALLAWVSYILIFVGGMLMATIEREAVREFGKITNLKEFFTGNVQTINLSSVKNKKISFTKKILCIVSGLILLSVAVIDYFYFNGSKWMDISFMIFSTIYISYFIFIRSE